MKTAPIGLARAFMVLLALSGSSRVSACSLNDWSAADGSVQLASPDGTAGGGVVLGPRYSGLCAMKASGSGYVQDNSPPDVQEIHLRFYFKADGAGNATLFSAYLEDAGNTLVFSLGFDGSNVILNVPAQPAAQVSAPGPGWHLVEVAWVSGNSTSLWVDKDATQSGPDATLGSGPQLSVGMIRLGPQSGLGGLDALFFDDYRSQVLGNAGALLACDTNSDALVNSADYDNIAAEFLLEQFSTGQVDCNADGIVNSGDLVAVADLLFPAKTTLAKIGLLPSLIFLSGFESGGAP